jgi:hypothetical protein
MRTLLPRAGARGSPTGTGEGTARRSWFASRRPARLRGAKQYPAPAPRWLARIAVTSIAASIALMAAVALLGPSAAVPAMPSAAPWPPYFLAADPAAVMVSCLSWLAVLTGGTGLGCALVALRRGWRPGPSRLIAGSVLAVLAFMLLPPLGSTDMLDYAAYGRIASIGQSPYVMTPLQLRLTGDAVGAAAPAAWQRTVSVYGPLATATQKAASLLAGDSAARTVFWLKFWNALAFLAVVLALDWFCRSDPARRARAHLLWSVNPLMLLAVVAGGHVDGLGAAFGVLALVALRHPGVRRGLMAGALAGVAIGIKAPFALFGAALAIAAFRSPRTLAGLGLGTAIVVVPAYAFTGPAAISATLHVISRKPDVYQPWQLLARLPWLSGFGNPNLLALTGTLALAGLLLWRLPSGPAELPAVRPALALTLAWLICSPQQRPWFDAMIFPLLALMPATGADWVVLWRAGAAAVAELPGVAYYSRLRPGWLEAAAADLAHIVTPVVLVIAAIVLVRLCLSRRLVPPPDDPAGPRWPRGPASTDRPESRQAGRAGPGPAQPGSAQAGSVQPASVQPASVRNGPVRAAPAPARSLIADLALRGFSPPRR